MNCMSFVEKEGIIKRKETKDFFSFENLFQIEEEKKEKEGKGKITILQTFQFQRNKKHEEISPSQQKNQ